MTKRCYAKLAIMDEHANNLIKKHAIIAKKAARKRA
jgi:hypothetical protein